MENSKKETRYTRHNKKRKIIGVSLYRNDQALMREKYGKILNGTQIKDIVLTGEFTEVNVVVNETPLNADFYNQLLRLGNNFNQIAYQANAAKQINNELALLKALKEFKEFKEKIVALL